MAPSKVKKNEIDEIGLACSDCGKKMVAADKVIKCSRCSKQYHPSCRQISDRECRNILKDGNWDCGNHHVKKLSVDAKLDKILKELETVKKSQEFLSDSHDDLLLVIGKLGEENKSIKNEMRAMAERFKNLKSELDSLKTAAHTSEQTKISANVIVRGLSGAEDPMKAMIKIANIVDSPLETGDIVSAQAIKTADRSHILVRFASNEKKKELMRSARAKRLGTVMFGYNGENKPIYIDEQLTKQSHYLLMRAKKLKAMGIKYVWVSNGDILVRCKDGDKVTKITSEEHIDNIEKNLVLKKKQGPTNTNTTVELSIQSHDSDDNCEEN